MEINRKTTEVVTYSLTEEECLEIIRNHIASQYGEAWATADLGWEIRHDCMYGARLKVTHEEVS